MTQIAGLSASESLHQEKEWHDRYTSNEDQPDIAVFYSGDDPTVT